MKGIIKLFTKPWCSLQLLKPLLILIVEQKMSHADFVSRNIMIYFVLKLYYILLHTPYTFTLRYKGLLDFFVNTHFMIRIESHHFIWTATRFYLSMHNAVIQDEKKLSSLVVGYHHSKAYMVTKSLFHVLIVESQWNALQKYLLELQSFQWKLLYR